MPLHYPTAYDTRAGRQAALRMRIATKAARYRPYRTQQTGGAPGNSIFDPSRSAADRKQAPLAIFLRLCRTSEPQKDPIVYSGRHLPRWREIKPSRKRKFAAQPKKIGLKGRFSCKKEPCAATPIANPASTTGFTRTECGARPMRKMPSTKTKQSKKNQHAIAGVCANRMRSECEYTLKQPCFANPTSVKSARQAASIERLVGAPGETTRDHPMVIALDTIS